MMKTISLSTFTLNLIIVCFSCRAFADQNNFLQCLSQQLHNYSSISNNIYTRTNSSFSSVLQSSIRNLRFAVESIPKPLAVITPEHVSQIPPIIHCAKKSALQIRTRSGGHDFEGLSYVAKSPFLVVDLINLSEVTVDVEEKTAWVESGASIGILYNKIAEKSPKLGFPAGICPTVGVGGHFSGGGYGTMLRKYGLAADHIIDARIIDVNGRILDRKSMGEDLFWAIRGGGGASFGVIVAWKVKLVDVPENVSVFTVDRTLEQGANQLIHRWQFVAPKMDKDLFIGIVVSQRNTTINASFFAQFLGSANRLLLLMQENFPELGLKEEDCTELSWIDSVLYIAGFPNDSPRVLLNRTQPGIAYFKGKTDYIQKPIPKHVFDGIWRHFYEPDGVGAQVLMAPYGGRMKEISDSAIPFPHRAGNLYTFGNLIGWREKDGERHIRWVRRVYDYMTPYASNSPRGAYINYRDLDIGVNDDDGETSYEQASIWGKSYFNNNFDRLVRVKTQVDPHNFFRDEQSIPIGRMNI